MIYRLRYWGAIRAEIRKCSLTHEPDAGNADVGSVLKKNINSVLNSISPFFLVVFLLLLWQFLSSMGIVPRFMLPSPWQVVMAFVKDFSLLMHHAQITLIEAFLGLGLGIVLGFFIALLMDRLDFFYHAIYPTLIISQTVPTVAIAPLLVLWLGYGILPKVALIVLTSFFPITIGLLDGFKAVDKDTINLFRSMGASSGQIFYHLKLPNSIGYFFAGLRISVSYAIIGAVVAEWLGGFHGLGVYMTRVRKSYSFDKMFAVIFFISAMSLALMYLVSIVQYMSMPWAKEDKNEH